jgi:NTE family protein
MHNLVMGKTKYALVLSGGGFKGAFQLGALNYLKEHWQQVTGEKQMHFDIIAGVSVGSLNGCFLSMNKLHELNTLWDLIAENGVEEIYTSDIIDTSIRNELKLKPDYDRLKEKFFPAYKLHIGFWQALGLLFFKNRREPFFRQVAESIAREAGANLKNFKSLADNAPLRQKLKWQVRLEDIHPQTRFYSGFVSLEDGYYHSAVHTDFTANEEFINAVLASTAMPLVWPPVPEVKTRNKTLRQLVDGGVVNVNPLGDVIELIRQDEDPAAEYCIFIVNCNTGTVEPDLQVAGYNIGQLAMRALDEITIAEVFRNDLEFFIRINDMVLQSGDKPLYEFDFKTQTRTNRQLRAFKYALIDPAPGELGNTLLAGRELIEKRIKHGWNRAAGVFGGKKFSYNHLC